MDFRSSTIPGLSTRSLSTGRRRASYLKPDFRHDGKSPPDCLSFDHGLHPNCQPHGPLGTLLGLDVKPGLLN